MYWVVAYDVVSDRRRQRLLSLLKDYGIPVQRSVVECDLDERRFKEMRERVLGAISRRVDKVNFYRACGNCWFLAERYGPANNFRQ